MLCSSACYLQAMAACRLLHKVQQGCCTSQAGTVQVCKYIDIPLQHMSNLVLLGMNRPARTHTVDLLEKLRSRIPGLALRTTFISGFPGAALSASFVRQI